MSLFTDKAPAIMALLIKDFDLTDIEAAAIVGNLGHESGGFKFLQEKKPLVPGSKGGYGWAQWTGPRRRQYEAYCKRNGLDPASDKANYGFLFVELTGSEKASIPAVKKMGDLTAKVKAFERAFERAGIKHYPSRVKYAEQALAAFKKAKPVILPPEPSTPIPDKHTEPPEEVGAPEANQPSSEGIFVPERSSPMQKLVTGFIFVVILAVVAEFMGFIDFVSFIGG